MALKNWKKTGIMTWQRLKKGHIQNTLYIDRKKIPMGYFVKKEWSNYGVHIGYRVDDGTKVTDRSEYFKTKSEALKYAKAYMRKN